MSINTLTKRLDKLINKPHVVDFSLLSDGALGAIVGNDATGQWLRSLSDVELEKVARGEGHKAQNANY